MDPLFQIALGLVPAILILALCVAVKWVSRPRGIFLLALFCTAALGCGGWGAFDLFRASTSAAAERVSPALVAELAQAAASQGDTALARALLKAAGGGGADAASVLSLARTYALEGDAAAASALYQKALALGGGDDFAEELAAARAAAMPGAADASAADLTAQLAREALEGQSFHEDLERAAKALSQVEECYTTYLSTGALDEDLVRRLGRRLDDLAEERPELFQLEEVRLLRLKQNILAQDFQAIAEQIGGEPGCSELLAVSELYLNGYIGDSDFDKDYGREYARWCDAVARQVRALYSSVYSGESKSVRSEVKAYMKSLEDSADHPALLQLKQSLYDYAQRSDAFDSSKAYLQLAKIENQAGNTAGAEQYLNAALDHVSACRDDDYTQPMYQIIGIIADKGDPERLKDVAGYVDRIVSNSGVIRLPEELTEAGQDAGQSGSAASQSADAQQGTAAARNLAAAQDPAGQADRETADFRGFMTDYVSQKRAAMQITQVDASRFPDVTASVSITTSVSLSDGDLAARLTVQDCNVDIGQFSLEKIEYSQVNVLLCCDVSGSMGGQAIQDLRQAVKLFAGNLEDNQQMALVTFSSDVNAVYPFGADQSDFLTAADSLRANGGTDMYGAALYAMDLFQPTEGQRNVIILLSDGEDNDRKSESDIMNVLGQAAKDKQVTLYSLGLGSSVDAEYLTAMSSACGGAFLYVDNSETLNSFYEYLNGLMFNQYELTYTAADTLRNSRSLHLSFRDDAGSQDTAYYTLDGSDPNAPLTGENALSPLKGVEITGLDTRLVFKGLNSQQIKLLGSGLTEENGLTVTIKGNVDYELEAKYESDSAWVVTVPAGVACGTYDLYVNVGGRTAVLERELVVAVQGQEKSVAFGPYVFTAYSVVREEGRTTLSGYVTMNGWLRFKDDVTLEGDLAQGGSVQMNTSGGAYVQYYEGSSKGLAALFAERNWKLELPSLGSRTLYNDTVHDPGGEDYRVETKAVPALYLNQVLTIATPGASLYPNRLEVDSDAFTTAFPFQDKLLKAAKLDLFTFNINTVAKFTAAEIGLAVDLEYGSNTKTYYPVNLGEMPIYFNPAEAVIKIDTVKNEYSLDFKVKLAFLGALEDGLGLKLAWDGSLVPDEIGVHIGAQINTTISGVPVTFSDFYFGMKDIDVNKSILDWTMVGKATASAVKVDSLLPGIGKYFGDVSVCSLKDATLELSLGQGHLLMTTDFYILGQIKLAAMEIEAGKFNYSCYLLNMDEEEVAGLRAKFQAGIMWDADNCDINISGSNELVLTNRLLGVVSSGSYDVTVQWWVLKKSIQADGAAVLGVYQAHNGDTVFILKGAATSNKNNKSVMVSWSKNSGFDAEIKL